MSTSILRVDFTVDLSPIQNEIAKHLPASFDEHGSPESGKYRWDLRELRGPTLIPLTGGKLKLSKSYYGDLETIGTFPGCHLGNSPGVYDPSKSWVYIDVNVSAKPTVLADGDAWSVRMTEVDVSVALGPNSDTKCSVFNVDVTQKLNELLGSDRIKQIVVAAVQQLNVPVPIVDLWNRANTPARLPLGAASGATSLAICVSLSLTQIDVEQLHGSPQAVTIPFAFYVDPQFSVTTQPACPPGQSPSKPKVVVK